MTIQIKELTVSKEMNKSDMSAVRGGWCLDVGQTLKEAAADSGAYGVIVMAAQIPLNAPVCRD
ncbi:MAG: hypothetical protein ACLPTF_26910 [Steroidobacteraceae bacterium]